jgi:hypothetical protein
MTWQHGGNVAYRQETDERFPHLAVGDTLAFPASTRAPQWCPSDLDRS